MYKNSDGSYCLDMFDPNFNGEADRQLLIKQQKEKEQLEEQEKIKNFLEQERKRKEKEFWDKHQNDGWINFD